MSVAIAPDVGSIDVVVYSNYEWGISGTSDRCTPLKKMVMLMRMDKRSLLLPP